MRLRRNGTVLFSTTLLCLSGGAFGLGLFLQRSGASVLLPAPMQLAQATQKGFAFHTKSQSELAKREERKGNLTPDADAREEAHRTFDTVYSLVKQHYVDQLPSENQMSRSAVRSMLLALNDPNCYFLEPEQFSLLDNESRGRFAGIGASLVIRPYKQSGYTEHKITVVAALPNSPAARAGLRPGDVITHIDGRWVVGGSSTQNSSSNGGASGNKPSPVKRGISLLKAQMALRGDLRTLNDMKLATEQRVLTVERPGEREPRILTIPTQVTEIEGVQHRILPAGLSGTGTVGYLRIPVFTTRTVEQLQEALKDFSGLPAGAGLILDLRDNPGGILDAAMTADALLSPGGPFVYEQITGGKQAEKKAGGRFPHVQRPIVVLVDRGTAAAAEALAASLADKGVATILGGKTFGDATVQVAYKLPDGSACVFTTGKMLSPRRRDWSREGLSPKIAVSQDTPENQVLEKAVEALQEQTKVVARRH